MQKEQVLTSSIYSTLWRLSRIMAAALMVLLLFATAGCAKEQPKTRTKGNKMSLLFKKPVYRLKVEAFGVSNYIEVNGVIVTFDTGSWGQTTVTLPVNHLMRSGENTIAFDVLPPKRGEQINPNSHVKIALTVCELTDQKNIYTVATLHFHGTADANKSHTGGSSPSGVFNSTKGFAPDKDGDVQVFDVTAVARPSYANSWTYTRKIDIPSSLPLWAFFNSEEMPDYQVNLKTDEELDRAIAPLYAEYQKVYGALEKHNVDAIMPMFAERNRELDMAFYLEPGTMEAELRDAFASTIKDMKEGNQELVGLRIRSVGFQLETNKKIASLIRRGMEPAIIINYVNKLDGVGSERYPMFFRYQNGKYILTR